MSESTSLGKIQLDVEFSRKSLNAEINNLKQTINNGISGSFKGMFNGMASQMNNFMKDSISRMSNGFKNFSQVGAISNEKVSQSVNKMNSEYEKTESKISEIRKELAKLFAEQDNIARTSQDMPAFSRMSKEASIEKMLKSNPRYQELSEKIDKLTTKMDPLVDKNRELAEEIKNIGDNAKDTGQKINIFGRSSEKAGNEAKKSSFKIKLFGNEMKKSGVKVAGFAAMINRSFMTILRRLFVYNLILKAIRSLMSYMSGALKANKEFVSSLNNVRTNLRVAFQPIYDFILPALNVLMQAVARVTTYIASAIAALFGKSYKQSYYAAKGIEKAKKAMDGYGSSTKKAQNNQRSFDEVNQIDIADDESGGGAGGFEMEMPDTSTIDMTGIERFKELMSSIFEPFKNAWENEGLNTINAAKYALDSIKGLIKAIGDSWREVWENGTGQAIVETVLRILQNIFNIVGNIATAFTEAWNTNEIGTQIIQHIFDLLNIILGTIEKITKATADLAKTLDFTPLLNSIDRLLQALQPLTQNIGDGLVWLWENALLPLAGWVIEDAVPVFLEMLAEAIRVVNNVIEALKPLGSWLWENFLKPLAEWTGGIVISVLEGIRDALKGIGDWVTDNKEEVQTFFAVFATWKATTFTIEMGKATAAVIAHTIAVTTSKIETLILLGLYAKDAIAKGISTAATWGQVAATTAWNGVAVIASGVTKAFGAAMAFITSPIGLVVAAIAAVIAIGVVLYQNWETIGPWLKGLWEGIKTAAINTWTAIKDFFINTWESIKTKTSEVWNGIKVFLENTIWNPIKTTASNIWNGIKSVISTVTDAIKTIIDKFSSSFRNTWDKLWDGAKTVFSNIWDSLTGIVKGVINGIIGIVNKFIDFWNKIELKVPSVNIPFVGKVGGFSIGVPKLANIPMLAKGGIIDQPTLAMVGERGKEAVVPFEDSGFLEALTGSIVNALLQILPFFTGGQGSQDSNDKEIVLNIEGTPLVRILLPLINNELTRLGYRNLFQVN